MPHVENGEAEPHRKRVDACSRREHDETEPPRRISPICPILLSRLGKRPVDRLPADEREESEGHPVVVSLDTFDEGCAGKPSDDGHHGLEQAEMKGKTEELSSRDAPQHDTRRNGHRKSVHRQTQGDPQNDKSTHALMSSKDRSERT